MGLSLLAGCDNEKQQIFTEAEKDLEQGSYEYALDEFTTSVNNGVKPAVSYRGIGICQLRLGNYDDAITAFTRVMVEAETDELCHQYVDSVVEVMEAEGLIVG